MKQVHIRYYLAVWRILKRLGYQFPCQLLKSFPVYYVNGANKRNGILIYSNRQGTVQGNIFRLRWTKEKVELFSPHTGNDNNVYEEAIH